MTTLIKSLFSFALVSVLVLQLSSCSESEDPGPLQEVSRNYTLSDFDRLEMGEAYHITVKQGNYFDIEVRGDRRNIDDLSVRKEGSTLVIRYDKYRNRRHQTYIEITMPTLEAVNFSGASYSIITGFDELSHIDVYLSGASTSQLDAESQSMHVVLSGASSLDIRGSGASLSANISGASKLKGFSYVTEECTLDLSGASVAKVNVGGSLDVTASGASHVTYRGNPQVNSNVSGASSVNRD